MTRNKGGRPPLDEGKRSFKIDVRFTEAEYRQVEEMERALGLKKTDVVRKRVLGESLAVVINARELLKRLDAISLELSRTGNNINQLARHANRLQKHGVLSPVIIRQFNDLLETHNRQMIGLEKSIRDVLRAGRKN